MLSSAVQRAIPITSLITPFPARPPYPLQAAHTRPLRSGLDGLLHHRDVEAENLESLWPRIREVQGLPQHAEDESLRTGIEAPGLACPADPSARRVRPAILRLTQ